MEKNTQLPVEVVNEIKDKAKCSADFLSNDEHVVADHIRGYEQGRQEGATAYASKLHQLQQAAIQSDKERKEANDQLREAKKLLDEVFRKHETGLLPDRFIYEKIKMFLYGE